jgi:hypothetical protein
MKLSAPKKLSFAMINYINLFYDARQRNPDVIQGSLKLHPDRKKFNINSGKVIQLLNY